MQVCKGLAWLQPPEMSSSMCHSSSSLSSDVSSPPLILNPNSPPTMKYEAGSETLAVNCKVYSSWDQFGISQFSQMYRFTCKMHQDFI